MKFTITNRKTGEKESLNLADEDTISIGRLSSNQIVIDANGVSRRHSEIQKINNNFFVLDLESGNGTLLNGKKLKPHEKHVLHSRDVIRVEEFDIAVSLSREPNELAMDEYTDSGIVEIKMIKKVLSAFDKDGLPSIELISEEGKNKRVFFKEDMKAIVIGRDADCEMMVDSDVVSRKHLKLEKKWGGITATDLGSKNGSFVNNEKISEQVLKDGDILTAGDIKFIFRNPQEVNLEDLSRDYKKQKAPPFAEAPSAEAPALEEKKPASISEEAKISVDHQEEKPPEDESVKTRPAAEPSVKAKTPLLSFSSTETILMAIGVLALLGAALALFLILK